MSWSVRQKLGGTPVASTASADEMGAHGRLLPTSRLEAFSDGVFAIAITLLVLARLRLRPSRLAVLQA